MMWIWTMMVAMLMAPPPVVGERAEQSDELPTTSAASVYRLSATGEELW